MLRKRKPDFVVIGACFLLTACCSAFSGNYVVAWGDNTYGQTNVPVAATNVQAAAAGYGFSLVLKADSTVIAWGQVGKTNVPAGLTNVVAIAAGFGQSLALKSDGTLIAWGSSSTSATTNVPTGLSNIVAIACGDDHNLVLKTDGTIFAWGANYSGQTNIPADLSNVVAIAAGNSASVAVKKDGSLWISGPTNHYHYPTNIVFGFSNAVATAIDAGGQQGITVLGNGSGYAWGFPTGTNIVIVSNVTAVASASPFNQAGDIWALLRNGTLIGLDNQFDYPSSFLGQTNVWMNLSNVLAMASGYWHHLAVVGDSLPLAVEPISNFGFSNGQFVVSQPTSLGRTYRLEYKNSLSDGWQIFSPAPGNGSTQTLADPNPPPSQRFYRVHAGQ